MFIQQTKIQDIEAVESISYVWIELTTENEDGVGIQKRIMSVNKVDRILCRIIHQRDTTSAYKT